MPKASQPPLQVWGGTECTVTNIGDRRTDQIERTGFAARVDDIDRFAALGIAALRTPLIWERILRADGSADWTLADAWMGKIRERQIRPIVGLLHHGAGPHREGFLSPHFPDRFAAFAEAVARRYPWVEDYIPINEPLTTARFSGLYGVWHPHGKDDATFARIQIAQCRATILAMRAIRSVQPRARLIQNEDVGTIESTPLLAYQAAFENERRWLTFDLLTGKLDMKGPIAAFLIANGDIDRDDLRWFRKNASPPDILGIDNYITSDRLLDERLARYPEWSHGGNGEQAYADIESVRATAAPPPGALPLMRQAWARYRIPLALAEVHLGCTRDEQLRWLYEHWRAAEQARAEGIDVRGVLVWNLLGAYDWNSLLRKEDGYYEPGAFDLRAPEPRPTAIARLTRTLARGEYIDEPVLGTLGWWRRSDRLFYPPVQTPRSAVHAPPLLRVGPRRPLLVAGTDEVMVDALRRICRVRGIDVAHEPDGDMPMGFVYAAGCEEGNDEASFANLLGACHAYGLPAMMLSCHHVLHDGVARPLVETDRVRPTRRCGERNDRRERAVIRDHRGLVIRTGPVFSPWMPAARSEGDGSIPVSPTYAPDLVNAALDLFIDHEHGIWHVANVGAVSWRAFIERTLEARGAHVKRDDASSGGTRHRRSRALASQRGTLLPSLDDAIRRWARERSDIEPSEDEALRSKGPDFSYPAEAPAATMTEIAPGQTRADPIKERSRR